MIPTTDRPARPNAARLKCAVCGRIFAAGHVPAPESHGPYTGLLICRDCRDDQYLIPF